MRARTAIPACLLLLAASAAISWDRPEPAGRFVDGTPIAGEESALARRAPAAGERDPELIASRSRALRTSTQRDAPAIAAALWRSEGPLNIGGRVTDLALHPTIPNLVYVATASGGVWRTRDAGLTFESIWPDDLSGSIGALAISADGSVLYVGTGEGNPGGGSLTYPGEGVFRSYDGGATWEPGGLATGSRIGRLIVDPRDPRRVMAAVAGDLFTPGGTRGIYATADGGDTWRKVLSGQNTTTGGIDLAMNPQRPDVIFAALWDHHRKPEGRVYHGVGSSLWRTRDGGRTWVRLGVFAIERGSLPGRIGVAVAPSNPDVVYADVVSQWGDLLGVYRSSDSGDTWSWRAGSDAGSSSFEWWFGRVWVDPTDPMHVFRASIDLQESVDGGSTWVPHLTLGSTVTGLNTLHADQHAMVFDPHVPERVFLGNDGGVYLGHLRAGRADWVKGGDQPWTQFYSLDVSEADPARIVGGTQDNGSIRSFRFTGASPEGWNRYKGGDGLATLISPADHNNVYACSQWGSCARSSTAGEVMQAMAAPLGKSSWYMPLVFDPSDPLVMYQGGEFVSRSTNGGVTWTVFSPRLPQTQDDFGPFGTITTIAASPADPGVVMAGTDDGAVWIRRDGTWSPVGDALPDLWVSRVAFDRADASIAYVALSGFRSGDGGAHIYRTKDAGASWQQIAAALPPAPINDLEVGPLGLVVGGDAGVFLSPDPTSEMPSWLSVGDGLPSTSVSDVRYHAPSGALFAATYGRGVWRIEL